MAGNYRSRPVGSIMDHPAFGNYEFHQRLSEPFSAIQALCPEFTTEEIWEQLVTGSDTFSSSPDDRFLCHERDMTLEEDSEDPLDLQYRWTGSIDLMDLDTDEVFQIRNERRRENQIARGFQPEPAVVPSRPTEDFFANTSLDEPESVSSEEPSQCRASRAEDVQFRGFTAAHFEDILDDKNFERHRVTLLEDSLEKTLANLASNKQENSELKARIVDLAEAWCTEDGQAHGKWQAFIFSAHDCSDAQVRIWSIATWYNSGVPEELSTAVDDLSANELVISDLTLRTKQLQVGLDYDNAGALCSDRRMLDDDETWCLGVWKLHPEEDFVFGDDYDLDIPNGIADLRAPKGKSGAALAQFIMANLETRKICVEQEQDEEMRTGRLIAFEKFLGKALKVADDGIGKLHGDDPARRMSEDALPQWWADLGALVDVQRALEDALDNVPSMCL